MTIPPFPSQDLAKLVLGYLAEEQLMTAYDEFLQASPYLDAHRNEYDRIFMTSLRNILAEYWAVKIFVETCKPLTLRKKLVQCTNLLDAVKLLVGHVDVSKLQSQETSLHRVSHKYCFTNHNQLPVTTRQSGCGICMSSSLTHCTCQDITTNISNVDASHIEKSALENSVEATDIENLPGNITSSKSCENSHEKEGALTDNVSLNASSNLSGAQSSGPPTEVDHREDPTISHSKHYQTSAEVTRIDGSMIKSTDTSDCIEKIEEFTNIFYKVCENKCTENSRQNNTSDNFNNQISNTTLHEFSRADDRTVASKENENVSLPGYTTVNDSQLSKQVGEITNDTSERHTASKHTNDFNKTVQNFITIEPEPKIKDKKIKIISDIKVESHTSKSLMQTISINGTPIYRQKPPKTNFTTDEIMAMPTLILVPATGPPSTVRQTQPKSTLSQSFNQDTTKTVSSERILGPLVIDVSSRASEPMLSIQQSGRQTGLVKTIDVTKNASVPKDNTIASAMETNTPHVQPPMRKSSSTPRRNSHIRVLDFTAPRRILQETIQEHPPNSIIPPLEYTTSDDAQPINTTQNAENTIVDMSTVTVHKIECLSNFQAKSTKGTDKKKNWDADLRALLAANEVQSEPLVKNRAKSKSGKKKLAVDKSQTKKDTDTGVKKIRVKKKRSPKKKEKRKQKHTEEYDDDPKIEERDTTKVIVKPTIKVISGDIILTPQDSKAINSSSSSSSSSSSMNGTKNEKEDKRLQETKESNDIIVLQDDKKVDNSEEINETPEAERLSLQNAIGVKLNISELLETPYKQALYDIQMETPRFLGPDLPDEPISDIKIMNIPTPRFFDTPKPAQTTPSSYSSRPTDYSSGGSYYKPDDQDYIPIPEIDFPMTSKSEFVTESLNDKENENKKTRPVRKCAKNVSYSLSYNATNKTKDSENVGSSISSNSPSSYKSRDNKCKSKTPHNNKCKSQSKSETKKRLPSCKLPACKLPIKYKSPIKKSNTFIQIKPRRPTPTKEARGKLRKKVDLETKLGIKPLNKISAKEKNIQHAPNATCVPTKSRRKSSTPRKIHCSKSFNCESSGQDSPEVNRINTKEVAIEKKIPPLQDSDTEQLALRWSDDGSQDCKSKKTPTSNESEDILKIQAYIKTSVQTSCEYDPKGSFHNDLIIRGFDEETAKIIERDLLDTPPPADQQCKVRVEIIQPNKDDNPVEKSVETSSSCTMNLQIDDEEAEEDEIELSCYECNEESHNYIATSHDYAKETFKGLPVRFKEKFSMEVCIDDGVPIRLRATDLIELIEHHPQYESELDFRETEQAVSSISNLDRLYTPLKDPTKIQCYEIFDSTLTSIDTPLKTVSPKQKEDDITEIEIVIDEECNGKVDTRKRKRLHSNSPEHASSDSKKKKSEAQYLLNSTNIQNIDIESVLTKLHGP